MLFFSIQFVFLGVPKVTKFDANVGLVKDFDTKINLVKLVKQNN